jgi:hypothetical protein
MLRLTTPLASAASDQAIREQLRQFVDVGLSQVWAVHFQFIHGLFGF